MSTCAHTQVMVADSASASTLVDAATALCPSIAAACLRVSCAFLFSAAAVRPSAASSASPCSSSATLASWYVQGSASLDFAKSDAMMRCLAAEVSAYHGTGFAAG